MQYIFLWQKHLDHIVDMIRYSAFGVKSFSILISQFNLNFFFTNQIKILANFVDYVTVLPYCRTAWRLIRWIVMAMEMKTVMVMVMAASAGERYGSGKIINVWKCIIKIEWHAQCTLHNATNRIERWQTNATEHRYQRLKWLENCTDKYQFNVID